MIADQMVSGSSDRSAAQGAAPSFATFVFTGRTSSGRLVAGERNAASLDEAVAALHRERIVVSRIRRRSALRFRFRWRFRAWQSRVTVKRVALFTRQFSLMVGAGMPIVECLGILAAQEEQPRFRVMIDDLRTDVEGGARLGDAMRRHPRVFDSLYTSMVSAGEVSGRLDTIAARLATLVEKQVALRGQVASASAYPAAVVSISGVVIAVILWIVIPTFSALFQGLGASLPLPTRLVIRLSEVFVFVFPLACLGSVGVWWGVRRYGVSEEGRRLRDRFLLQTPVLGGISRQVALARFCRTLSTLLASGIPILEGLETTARTTGNVIVEDAVMAARDAVEDGQALSIPLRRDSVFPSMLCHMVQIGESTGTLDATLTKVAEFYEGEVDASARGLLSLLEPVLIAVIGVVVGGIVVAMYLPIFDLVSQLAF